MINLFGTALLAKVGLLLVYLPFTVYSQSNATWATLRNCSLSSFELASLEPETNHSPCLLYDERGSNVGADNVEEVTIVQVTPSSCANHRDGVLTSVRKLNADNEGKGFPVGYVEADASATQFVQFRFISIVAGNSDAMGSESYGLVHEQLLGEAIDDLDVQYIAGTCSFASAYERNVSLSKGVILMAQVGPAAYYGKASKYIFGIHVDSGTYPDPFLRQIALSEEEIEKADAIKIEVIGRTKSDFFNSTCQAAVESAKGFSLMVGMQMYDPEADENKNGVKDSEDLDWIQRLGNEACPGPKSRRAIVACVGTSVEAEVLLETFRSNDCVPEAIWFTSSLWSWGLSRPSETRYMFGSGQWHSGFPYADSYFDSGVALQEYNREEFGYTPSYDTVASYAIAQTYAAHIQNMFRTDGSPKVVQTFQDDYESARRNLNFLTVEEGLFGPVRFNAFQRNVGRGPASSQYLPEATTSSVQAAGEPAFSDRIINPAEVAQTLPVIPAPGALPCDKGAFRSSEVAASDSCVLCSKCVLCPSGEYTGQTGASECRVCESPAESRSSQGSTGCVIESPNLIPDNVLALGYALVGLVWCFALVLIAWIWRNGKDPVVRIGQPVFLTLICIGTIISSSTTLALSVQNSGDESWPYSASAATAACQAAPFLYAVGWSLQYGSLSAKTFRLYKIFVNPKLVRETISTKQMLLAVTGLLIVEVFVVMLWTVLNPLQWVRTVGDSTINRETNTLTINSVGQCQSKSSVWPYLSVLIIFQVGLMVLCNVLLYKLRTLRSRYQERKYITFASVLTTEVFLLGLPIVILLSEETTTRYVVIAIIIFLSDFGVLCCIFVPKIYYLRVGLPEGMNVMDSLTKNRTGGASMRTEGHSNNSNKSEASFRTKKQVLSDDAESSERASAPKRLEESATSFEKNDVAQV